ncbi:MULTISPECIES: PhzF family phenazine biosynthesis protein [unclassified Halomonas]|uniref:PhzF family phenazine biosynthesis protein n=1 Tax=unclassified Halomonas TaxID=2609666 RepID=UPI001EF6190A|nr:MULTISPECIES: PhzF family phenazine biosynthesis protein [unclassified Halomonas]MCG7578496.1 PhzF family phenazine biosynthesis protein [Halomonas sp. MMH1-48]MCG7605608.1 PhzF family phenazine biosynthesis protein [Halomonas sp. MM17-34]MCG7614791.1 PhzF family phenazine biosynthesis protein [Halomonas sp. MM17-29]MCG7621663.1 PhzF family phenazine biosynthesis protein [Halomonas sp. DSH1-27]
MTTAEYYLLDVFTDQPFTGNPLAVFLNADGLDAHTMQALANELNLAETVFLSAEAAPQHYPMRIFTPTRELPFAGHPTVGTAHLLTALKLTHPEQPLVLHPPIGELAITSANGKATFKTSQAVMLADSTLDHPTAVALLGLDIHQVVGDPVIASFGLPFHLIELSDTSALESVTISAALWASAVMPSRAAQIYPYVREPSAGQATVIRSRMFCMHDSLCEDPATGSAAAALTGYLASLQTEALRCEIHQGIEMGRPSVIYTAANGDMTPGFVTVGGHAIVVGKGTLYLP